MTSSNGTRCNTMAILVVCALCSALSFVAHASTVVVDAPFGKIKGARKTDVKSGLSYEIFKGIPFAKPPVGDLRFAKPQPLPRIDGVFDASNNELVACPQSSALNSLSLNTKEDCLVLNIQYKEKQTSDKSLKKVLVYVHGGGFFGGLNHGDFFTSFVMSQDVIMVTFNYRLDVLGFLSTDDEASPGNYGLWDQIMALKWVKDNIRAFGGDPNDVTVGGKSSGGTSVGYLMITPHAKGLFTKAYIHSGTATSIFAQNYNTQSHALTFAKSVGCWGKESEYKLNVDESKTVIKCLRSLPVSELQSSSTFSLEKLHFVPRVDNDYISDLPFNLLNNDDYLDSVNFFNISLFTAFNTHEDCFMERYIHGTFSIDGGSVRKSDEEETNNLDELKIFVQKLYVKLRYGKNEKLNDDIIKEINVFYNRRFLPYRALIELITDLNFLIPSFDYVVAASRRKPSNAYLMYFNHYPQYMKGDFRGSHHGIDLFYFLDWELNVWGKNLGLGIDVGKVWEDDVELKETFMSIMGEFVRTGNPGGALTKDLPRGWPNYEGTNEYYLDFSPTPWVGTHLKRDTVDFWFNTVPSLLNKERRHTEL